MPDDALQVEPQVTKRVQTRESWCADYESIVVMDFSTVDNIGDTS